MDLYCFGRGINIRHLIGGERIGAQAAFRIVYYFFHGHPSDALYDPAFHLPFIYGGIHAGTIVVYYLHGVHRISTPQTVYRYFQYRGTIYMISKGMPFFPGGVKMDLWGGIMPM